jgi:ubiquinone/menaquinone biosynthesis C-methylase UbiE
MSKVSPTDGVAEQMRREWNDRAREDAHYYVAFGGRDQEEEGFLTTGREVIGAVEWELKRFPPAANHRAWRALEIGCGPGRLMKPLSRDFGEIHGVDVSDEMIRLARERLRDIPHAHVHVAAAGLLQFADDSFDIVYSYAVYQHIPSRDVVLEYMRETQRVLKPGGIFRGQYNSLPPNPNPNTWHGVCFYAGEIRAFTREHGLQLLALEGVGTQYMWTTWRKLPLPTPTTKHPPPVIRRITNALSSESLVPNAGRHAAIAIWIVNLPQECDLNTLDVRIDGRSGTLTYIGPPESGNLQQVNVALPPHTRTGIVPVELWFSDVALCPPSTVRVIPAGPLVPRVISITDGINIVHENRSTTGSLKVHIEEVQHPEQITATIDGRPVRSLEFMQTDPLPPRYELNFLVPEGLAPGPHTLQLKIGNRALLPNEIDVVQIS